MDELQVRANACLEDALATSPIQDPRSSYRDRLRTLKAQDSAAFERALRYFQDVLVPRVADQTRDPLAEWLEYGRLLAELSGPGRIVGIDAGGRARPHELVSDGSVSDGSALVLHLPDDARAGAFVLALPRRPTRAQQATVDLLVSGKTSV